MKRKVLIGLLAVIVMASVVSCATLKQNWDSATPAQREAVVLYGFQKALDAGLDSGIAYVAAHPEKKAEWQTKIIPIFDATNKILRDLMVRGQAGEVLTYFDVAVAVVGRFMEINAILGGWGIKVQF